MSDPHHLSRFIEAQNDDYEIALAELKRGKKESHWIWYIFPQLAGLGHSPMAQTYAINSKDEAVAYLEHEVLGHRLRECAAAVLSHEGKSIQSIMGYPDDLKLCSSMTLFASLSEVGSPFHQIIDRFYNEKFDDNTLKILNTLSK